MIRTEPRRTVIHRPPPTSPAKELEDQLSAFSGPDILDVREESLL